MNEVHKIRHGRSIPEALPAHLPPPYYLILSRMMSPFRAVNSGPAPKSDNGRVPFGSSEEGIYYVQLKVMCYETEHGRPRRLG